MSEPVYNALVFTPKVVEVLTSLPLLAQELGAMLEEAEREFGASEARQRAEQAIGHKWYWRMRHIREALKALGSVTEGIDTGYPITPPPEF